MRNQISKKETEELQAIMQRRWGNLRMVDRRAFNRWEARGRVKHRLGIHTFVPLEYWDKDDDHVEYRGQVCWFCEKPAP